MYRNTSEMSLILARGEKVKISRRTPATNGATTCLKVLAWKIPKRDKACNTRITYHGQNETTIGIFTVIFQ